MRAGNRCELVTRGGYHLAAPVSETDDMVSVESHGLSQPRHVFVNRVSWRGSLVLLADDAQVWRQLWREQVE